jgi:hypothetical protein
MQRGRATTGARIRSVSTRITWVADCRLDVLERQQELVSRHRDGDQRDHRDQAEDEGKLDHALAFALHPVANPLKHFFDLLTALVFLYY